MEEENKGKWALTWGSLWESSYSPSTCVHTWIPERSPLFLPEPLSSTESGNNLCAKQKCLTLMLPRKQTLQHMHLHTSSRTWLTAHTPTNCAVSGWPLSGIPSTWTWALLCNCCSATTYHKYALTESFPKVSLTVHAQSVCTQLEFLVVQKPHQRQDACAAAHTHPGCRLCIWRDFCPGKISMKKLKSCPGGPMCRCLKPCPKIITLICSHILEHSGLKIFEG